MILKALPCTALTPSRGRSMDVENVVWLYCDAGDLQSVLVGRFYEVYSKGFYQ